LSPREAFHVAIIPSGAIVGYQSLDLYSVVLPSMSHVGQLGTFVLPSWRGHGIGWALFPATREFADAAGYRKLVSHERASNVAAQRFYSELGFRQCGRLRDHVVIDGCTDDEILMVLAGFGSTEQHSANLSARHPEPTGNPVLRGSDPPAILHLRRAATRARASRTNRSIVRTMTTPTLDRCATPNASFVLVCSSA
jgi:predicted N-acetyltransferase YhbS